MEYNHGIVLVNCHEAIWHWNVARAPNIFIIIIIIIIIINEYKWRKSMTVQTPIAKVS